MKKLTIGLVFFLFGLILTTNSSYASERDILVSFNQGNNISLRFFGLDNKYSFGFSIFNENFIKGVNLDVGDVDGDGINEIIIAPKKNGSWIKILTKEGILKYPTFYLDKFSLKNGINLAVGDLNGDAIDEIVASSGEGGIPEINILNYQGTKVAEPFLAFPINFRGGVSLSCGDINRDRKEEIIIGSGRGVEPIIKVFNIEGKQEPIELRPFNSEYRYGIEVAAGDVEGDGRDEISVCQSSKGSRCKIYRYDNRKTILNQWSAYKDVDYGVNLAMADVNNDGKDEVITDSKDKGFDIHIFGNGKNFLNFFNYYPSSALNGQEDFTFFTPTDFDETEAIYVDDGDTIFTSDGFEVRYIGVDTPEIGQPYYLQATNKNKELVSNKKIILKYDRQKIDPNGRRLAYVFVGETLVNLELVKEGLAKTEIIYPDVKYAKDFLEAEKEAKREKRGMWK